MSRVFDGQVYFGRDAKCIVDSKNVLAKLALALEAVVKMTAEGALAKEVKAACAVSKFESKFKQAITKLNADQRHVYLRSGLSQGDIILHLKYSDTSLKEEIFFIVYRGYTKASRVQEKIISLQPDDKIIAGATETFKKVKGAKIINKDAWPKVDDQHEKVGPTEPLGLFAHGAAKCPDKVTIVGVQQAGHHEGSLATSILRKLPEGYSGEITLYGCFTGAGDPQGKDNAPLAKKVHELIKKAGFAKARVRGMPDSWSTDSETAEVVIAESMLMPRITKPGIQSRKGVELIDGEKHGAYIRKDGNMVIGSDGKVEIEDTAIDVPSEFIKKLQITVDALDRRTAQLEKEIYAAVQLEYDDLESGDRDTGLPPRIFDAAQQSSRAQPILKEYLKVRATSSKQFEQIQVLQKMPKSEVRNWIRTFRDKGQKA